MSKVSIILLFCALFAWLETSFAIKEGRISGADRFDEPGIKACLNSKSCPVTFDFTPTCASDGRTYSNERSINCLNECLKPEERLTVVSGGYCKDDAPTSS